MEPEQRKSMGTAARQSVRENFSKKRVVEMYLKEIEQLFNY